MNRLIAVNVQPDHIHIVLVIPPRIAVADVVKYLKVQSAKTCKSSTVIGYRGIGMYNVRMKWLFIINLIFAHG